MMAILVLAAFIIKSAVSAQMNYAKSTLGDTIKLKNIYTSKEIPLTIIGIYGSSEERANANTIYMNTETAAKFLSKDDCNSGNYDVDNVSFYMTNSDLADEFVEKINSEFTELSGNNLKVAVDTTEYDQIAGSIESVGGFANTILVIVTHSRQVADHADQVLTLHRGKLT